MMKRSGISRCNVAVLAAVAAVVWLYHGPSATAQTAPDATVQGAAPADNTAAIETMAPEAFGATAYGPPAAFTGATPTVGTALPLGNLGATAAAARALGAQAVAPRFGLTIVPSLSLQELFTTNATGTSGRHDDFITTATPGLLLNERTRRLHATINYAPQAQIYARTPSEDYVGQQLNALADSVLLPRALFLSLRGFATEQSTFGGLPPGGTVALGRHNRTSTLNFSATPSAVHRFGDIGTAALSFQIQRTTQNGNAAFATGSSTPFFIGSTTTTKQEAASFTTGSILGRFNHTLAFDAEQSDSNLALANGARQVTYSDTLRVAVTRLVTLIGEVGHEDIRYNGAPPTRIRDIIWNGGFALTPAQHSTITARYGHRDGFNSLFVQGVYPVTARTRLYFATSESLGTQAQELQSNLASSSLNAAGTPVNSETGAPILLTNQLVGTQSNLFRSRHISIGATTTWSRDILNLSFLDTQQKLVAITSGLTGFSQNSISGSISLTHKLTPVVSALAYMQYGTTTLAAPGGGSNAIYAGQFSLVYQLSKTLTADALYNVNREVTTNGSGTTLTNTVGVGIQKIF